MNKIKDIFRKVFSFDQGKYLLINLILTLILNLYLEMTMRRSVTEVLAFVRERTFLFLFNGLIIFTTLSLVLLLRKKIFAYAMLGGVWVLIGLANGVILSNRKTPFTAVDLSIAKSALPIIGTYLSMWQIVLVFILLVALIAGMVCLFLFTREQKRDFDASAGAFWVLLIFVVFTVFLKIGTTKGVLERKFDNLMDAYRDYGVAYSFFITAVDTGIDRPLNYSESSVKKILNKVDKKIKKTKEKGEVQDRYPNIVFVQLESFFDPTLVKDLEMSEDPLPNLHRLQKDYTSGRLKVPVYGAGTINTEFEVITGMDLDHFGSGEYPYRSILHKRTCDNISYWLKDRGYVSSVVHNNTASFYDRDKVYCNLGFDNFVSVENMNVTERNANGWPKDYILEDQILDVLDTTPQKDMIYTISVQGHGDYPTTESEEPQKITVNGENLTDKYRNAWTYYVNEIREMDDFVGRLTNRLSSYPEEVVVIVYGDHLPGMNIESEDLTKGTKYQTPYIIWDNFGYNKEHAKEESGNLEAWQLSSKVLGQSGRYEGVLNRYHQTMNGTKKYKKNLRLLEYDMLYGSNFVRILKGEKELKPTEIAYGVHNPRITGIAMDEITGDYILSGSHFTDQSRVYGDHIMVRSEKLSDTRILIPAKALSKMKEFSIIQVNANNDKIHYNQSDPWEVDMENVELLPETDPAWTILRQREAEANVIQEEQ